ncbi:MAG: tetratricopeptide repeat protein [Methylacidiphilales bacterium]|nr:tetratricopeptide repeat protein [Candidatus Methylacidiphilales bacterium]
MKLPSILQFRFRPGYFFLKCKVLLCLLIINTAIAETNTTQLATEDLETMPELKIFNEDVSIAFKSLDKSDLDPDSIRAKADRLIERSLGLDISVTGEILDVNQSVSVDPITTNTTKIDPLVVTKDSLYQLQDSIFDDKFLISNLDTRIINEQIKVITKEEIISKATSKIKSSIPDIRTKEEISLDEMISKMDDLQIVNLAITLYEQILLNYPSYDKNDYVLYQLARAYSDIGNSDKSIQLLSILIKGFPTSKFAAESYFRKAEYFSIRGDLAEADRNYIAVLNYGPYSDFYEYALYKRGWSKFRQGSYDDALNSFTELLDIRMLSKYDYDELVKLNASGSADPNLQKLQDTLRAISLSFSYLQGVNDINRYFKKIGRRKYENLVYEALANYYIEKQRYTEAAEVYQRFINIYPYHTLAPSYYLKMSKVYDLAGFTNLEIELRKNFARSYDLRSVYWTYFDLSKNQEIIDTVSKNLVDLAGYYHNKFQQSKKNKIDTTLDFNEAKEWYERYLASFPNSKNASEISYYLGELYYSNQAFDKALLAYENSAYVFQKSSKSAEAAYATVVVSSLNFDNSKNSEEKVRTGENMLATSLKFTHTYPTHPESKNIQLRTAKLLFETKKYVQAVAESKFLLTKFGNLSNDDKFSAWRIIAYSLYDGDDPKTSETAITEALKYAPNKTAADKLEITNLTENLAASIFKQAEKLKNEKKYDLALATYKRVAQKTPNAKNRQNADYDIATIYIIIKDWKNAITSLELFRKQYQKSSFLPDITKKLAVSYKEDVRFEKAAVEFERIETEQKDESIRKQALIEAANLYVSLADSKSTIRVYNKFINLFPKPLEDKLAMLDKLSYEYKKINNQKEVAKLTQQIFNESAKAKGGDRTDKVLYYMASAELELKKPEFESYQRIKLKEPLKKSLKAKKDALQRILTVFGKLTEYKIANVTSGATYYLGLAYLEFSKAFVESERPKKLKGLELEQYNEILEEQAAPFEENGVKILEKNLELINIGLYDKWIQQTIDKLGEIFPARFAKKEKIDMLSDDLL